VLDIAHLPAPEQGNKKPACSYAKAGAVALAEFVMRPQAEIKSALIQLHTS
jgi:hypothetical protein